MMDLQWELIAAVAAGAAMMGHVLGKSGEARYWRGKADPQYRTAMCSAGKFFYVLPESEFVTLTIEANKAKRGWRDIATAPRDGSPVDLIINGKRETDCWWQVGPHGSGWFKILPDGTLGLVALPHVDGLPDEATLWRPSYYLSNAGLTETEGGVG